MSVFAHAQDTTSLAEVDIVIQKTELSSIGKRCDHLDSLTKQLFVFNSIGDVLRLNSNVFIKNYGPGALSSTSIRGGNASQTAVLWNGLNIQNPMLGQIDLSLLPTVLFENINIEYGGSSSLWGSGAVAGSIQLINSAAFNKGFTSRVNLNAGSFGLLNASSNIEISKTKFYSSTKSYLQNSNNNFRFKDTLNQEQPIQEQKNASYSFKGILQEFKYLINTGQNISFNAWYNIGYRQLPNYKNIPATQTDDNFKSTLNWNYFFKRYNSSVKTAYFSDKINYDDSLISIHSKSNSKTIIIENENLLRWSKNHQLNFGLNHTFYSAISNNYYKQKQISKTSVILGNKFNFIQNKLIVHPVLRAEYFSTTNLPVTGNLSIEYQIIKSLRAKINGAKVYRQPTLNELYWLPGGNINLLPEQGFSYDGDLEYSNKIKNILISISGSAFTKIIDNWILWLPGTGGSPTPVNIQSVWSRGTEGRLKINYLKNKLAIRLNLFTAYTLSTVKSNTQDNGNTLNKQLIYTPRYCANANITIAYDGVSLTYFQQYSGYSFITSDNTQWLNPYHYSSVRMNLNANFKPEAKAIFFFACNNLFNSNYKVVAGYYMPLRSFEIGISLINNKPNKLKIN